jgi:manganese transport protein
MQLSFAVIPLVQFTGNKRIMGEFVNAVWVRCVGWIMAVIIAGLNVWLLVMQFQTGF